MKTARTAATIRVGDTVRPPEREMRLWMRRHAAEKGLDDHALWLNVTEVREGMPDKRGRWLVITGLMTPQWYGVSRKSPWTFKARPETPWPIADDYAAELSTAFGEVSDDTPEADAAQYVAEGR
jgi:hypothetical protein